METDDTPLDSLPKISQTQKDILKHEDLITVGAIRELTQDAWEKLTKLINTNTLSVLSSLRGKDSLGSTTELQVYIQQTAKSLAGLVAFERTAVNVLYEKCLEYEKFRIPGPVRFIALWGVRRVGKTTLVKQVLQKLHHKGRMLMIDCETLRSKTSNHLEQLIIAAAKEKVLHIFLDEIQTVKDWDSVIYSLQLNPDTQSIQFFITGSREIFSSRTVASKFVDRHFPSKVRPLSFREFTSVLCTETGLDKWSDKEWLVRLFRFTGGFPYIVRLIMQHYIDLRQNTEIPKKIQEQEKQIVATIQAVIEGQKDNIGVCIGQIWNDIVEKDIRTSEIPSNEINAFLEELGQAVLDGVMCQPPRKSHLPKKYKIISTKYEHICSQFQQSYLLEEITENPPTGKSSEKLRKFFLEDHSFLVPVSSHCSKAISDNAYLQHMVYLEIARGERTISFLETAHGIGPTDFLINGTTAIQTISISSLSQSTVATLRRKFKSLLEWMVYSEQQYPTSQRYCFIVTELPINCNYVCTPLVQWLTDKLENCKNVIRIVDEYCDAYQIQPKNLQEPNWMTRFLQQLLGHKWILRVLQKNQDAWFPGSLLANYFKKHLI